MCNAWETGVLSGSETEEGLDNTNDFRLTKSEILQLSVRVGYTRYSSHSLKWSIILVNPDKKSYQTIILVCDHISVYEIRTKTNWFQIRFPL